MFGAGAPTANSSVASVGRTLCSFRPSLKACRISSSVNSLPIAALIMPWSTVRTQGDTTPAVTSTESCPLVCRRSSNGKMLWSGSFAQHSERRTTPSRGRSLLAWRTAPDPLPQLLASYQSFSAVASGHSEPAGRCNFAATTARVTAMPAPCDRKPPYVVNLDSKMYLSTTPTSIPRHPCGRQCGLKILWG
jgi:hypothetical protein